MHTQHLTITFAGMGFGFLSLSYFICKAAGKLVWQKITLKKDLKTIREAA